MVQQGRSETLPVGLPQVCCGAKGLVLLLIYRRCFDL